MTSPFLRGPVHIYTLRAPKSDRVRYVGATNNPVTRLRSHIGNARNDERAQAHQRWIYGLLRRGAKPVMQVIEIWPDPNEAVFAERWAMWSLMVSGHRLLNTHKYDTCNADRPPNESNVVSWRP